MKRGLVLLAVLTLAMATAVVAKQDCTTLRDGTLVDTWNNPLVMGYDAYGYNYQSHMFNGWYWNNQRPQTPYTKETIDTAPSKTWLIMKWSEDWLSNQDCNDDGKLDRGYSCNPDNPVSSACTGAWLTNHQWGSYEQDGKTCKWNYFVKMVYPGDDAYNEGGMWYTDETKETEIGSVIWGAYARILQVYNDPCAGDHGVENNWEAPTGFGYYG